MDIDYWGGKLKVTGMVGTIDSKIVPLDTPNAKPWYDICPDNEWLALCAQTRILLTDGDKYCCQMDANITRPLPFDNKGQLDKVRNAIERYNKEISA